LVEAEKRRNRETGRGHLEIQLGSMCQIAIQLNGTRHPLRCQRQNFGFNAEPAGTSGNLVDDLLDPPIESGKAVL